MLERLKGAIASPKINYNVHEILSLRFATLQNDIDDFSQQNCRLKIQK